MLKLDCGYNIGLRADTIQKLTKLGYREAHYKVPEKTFPKDPHKPDVKLLGTGGTIASRLDYRTGAVIPAFSAGELYGSVPELADVCNLETEKLFGVFSENMGPREYMTLAEEIGKAIRAGFAVIVIGHGTDTMHHTAAALSFMVQRPPVPIVMVGSQRSSDRPSSDEDGDVTDGFINFKGQRIDKTSQKKSFSMGIFQVMEGRRVFGDLTVEENLVVGGHTNQNAKKMKQDMDMVFHYFPRLVQRRNTLAGYISGGEQQMLVIGRGLMASPKLMLLDEPSMGLSPLLVSEIFEIIKRINREEGVTILLVEQNARLALSIADHGYVMENGRIVLDDESDKLEEPR